jgi:hypothetical protein
MVSQSKLSAIFFISRRSQWPRSLRHELSSLARTLSWVRIPLKAVLSVYAIILCLCCPVVYVAALRQVDNSSKESYRLCKKDYETEEEAKAQQRAVESLMNDWKNEWILISLMRVSFPVYLIVLDLIVLTAPLEECHVLTLRFVIFFIPLLFYKLL